jgi:protein translocase SecG subunit
VGFIIGFLYFIFILSSLVLIGVILIQEGKGGGFAEAFSGVGGETFGVRATGLHRFTGIIAAIFVASAVLVSVLRGSGSAVKLESPQPIPVTPPFPTGEAIPGGAGTDGVPK